MKNTNNTTKANNINGNSKGVRCLTDGKYYPRVKDAAKANGVANSTMSYAISHKTLCKGKEFRFESDTEYNMMKMAINLDEYRAKAIAYDQLMAKQEAERKAKEEREKKITKLTDKVEHQKAVVNKANERWVNETNKLMALERELEDLMDEMEEVC